MTLTRKCMRGHLEWNLNNERFIALCSNSLICIRLLHQTGVPIQLSIPDRQLHYKSRARSHSAPHSTIHPTETPYLGRFNHLLPQSVPVNLQLISASLGNLLSGPFGTNANATPRTRIRFLVEPTLKCITRFRIVCKVMGCSARGRWISSIASTTSPWTLLDHCKGLCAVPWNIPCRLVILLLERQSFARMAFIDAGLVRRPLLDLVWRVRHGGCFDCVDLEQIDSRKTLKLLLWRCGRRAILLKVEHWFKKRRLSMRLICDFSLLANSLFLCRCIMPWATSATQWRCIARAICDILARWYAVHTAQWTNECYLRVEFNQWNILVLHFWKRLMICSSNRRQSSCDQARDLTPDVWCLPQWGASRGSNSSWLAKYCNFDDWCISMLTHLGTLRQPRCRF